MIHYWWVKKNRIKDLYNKKQIDLYFLKLSKEILYTNNVSFPPTILSPSPVLPFSISMYVSFPGMIGQVLGSLHSGC
jgi:hypothetical protein